MIEYENSTLLIDCFWEKSELRKNGSDAFCWHDFNGGSGPDYVPFLRGCDELEATAAFLLIAIFLDQVVYTHFRNSYKQCSDYPHKLTVYERFRRQFFFPKFVNCYPEGGNMVSASAFLMLGDEMGEQVFQDAVDVCAKIIFGDVYRWFLKKTGSQTLYVFHNYLIAELAIELGRGVQLALLPVLEDAWNKVMLKCDGNDAKGCE